MNIRQLLLLTILIGSAPGCATLNKSECREADWTIIGLEDGSAGRPVSYIGRHREACAEYGVKPDLTQYQHGHADGVRLFCTPRKGFQLGRAARGHHEVCPADLRNAFLNAYADGLELRAAQTAVDDAQNRLNAAHGELERISNQVAHLETLLINGAGTALDRQNWLDEVKQLRAEEHRVQEDIHRMEHEVSDNKREFDYLSRKFQY